MNAGEETTISADEVINALGVETDRVKLSMWINGSETFTDQQYAFTMPDNDVTVYCELAGYTVTLNYDANGGELSDIIINPYTASLNMPGYSCLAIHVWHSGTIIHLPDGTLR